MNHKYKIVWLSDDLEGYECVRCKHQTVDPEEDSKCTYWYMYHDTECVLCGAGRLTKYRVYDRPKPENVYDRYERIEYVCGYHFV